MYMRVRMCVCVYVCGKLLNPNCMYVCMLIIAMSV